jgi:hypothetical protein
MSCKECGRELDSRPNDMCPAPVHWRAWAGTMEVVVKAVLQVLVDNGPTCLVCGDDVEADDDPCDTPCSGLDLRKAVHGLAFDPVFSRIR